MKTNLKYSGPKLDHSQSGYRPVKQESENINTMDTQASNTVTKEHPPLLHSHQKREETKLPPPSIPISDASETSSPTPEQVKEEVTPDDSLTRNQQKVADKLTSWYATIGLFVAGTDAYDGVLLIKSSKARSEEVVKACRHNKQAWNVLTRMTEASDIGNLIVGHGLMLYAILAHHGKAVRNDPLLAQLGYHESQILAPPPEMEGMNGNGNSPFVQHVNP